MGMKAAVLALAAGATSAGCAAGPPAEPVANAPASPAAQVAQLAPVMGSLRSSFGQAWQVRRFACAQLLAAPEHERTATAMFYYGYLAGRTKIEAIDPARIDADVRRVFDQCAHSPAESVADAFQQTLSKPPRWFWQLP